MEDRGSRTGPEIERLEKIEPEVLRDSRPLGALNGPRDRQKSTQDGKPVPGKVSGHLGADVEKKTRRWRSGEDIYEDEGGEEAGMDATLWTTVTYADEATHRRSRRISDGEAGKNQGAKQHQTYPERGG